MRPTTVLLDLGETLWDETPLWQGWADFLGVSLFTLAGVIGATIERGVDHREFLPHLRPGADLDELLAAKPPVTLGVDDLYLDALPCLRELAADGWQVVVGGNQPATFQVLVEALDLPVDLVVSSETLGAAKPSPEFFVRAAARACALPAQCVSVGDRVDNDVEPALGLGMAAVHLVRGPWGMLSRDDPALQHPRAHQLDGLAELPSLLRSLR